MALPAVLSVEQIRERLSAIFPEGTPNRNYVAREMAAKTVFVMLYAGAVTGTDRWIRPDQVTRMTDAQAGLVEEVAREAWSIESLRPGTGNIEGRWYQANTREPIRDEALRDGLVRMGAVVVRVGLATTSPLPRYALAGGFAASFDPQLAGGTPESVIEVWREANLSSAALARVEILRHGAVAREGTVLVTFPGGEARQTDPGPSSVISKAVVEEFAPRFLEKPAVIWLSESRNKVVKPDDDLAKAIGLTIEPDRNLPDLILADLGPEQPLLVFIGVVAGAGPISESRRSALMAIAADGGFGESQVAFVTAYSDRDDSAFKRSVSEFAWRSFAWFASEPGHVVALHRGGAPGRRWLIELMT